VKDHGYDKDCKDHKDDYDHYVKDHKDDFDKYAKDHKGDYYKDGYNPHVADCSQTDSHKGDYAFG